jgi:beta-mannosidase
MPSPEALTPQRWGLDGAWSLSFGPDDARAPTDPAAVDGSGWQTVPAAVPGNVELDLLRAGLIEEPFYAANIEALRPLESNQWWYRRRFTTPARPATHGMDLVFEGLDCFATVWLNGRQVGESANALIAQRFAVTAALAPAGQPNELVVRLRSAVNAVREVPLGPCEAAQSHAYDSLWARKPAHAYGWDIMPRAVSAGLWRPVYLEERRPTELTEVFVMTRSASTSQAVLDLTAHFRTETAHLDGFELRVAGRCGDSVFEARQPLYFTSTRLTLHVPSPRLWWPRGYGAADLYDTTVELWRHGQPVSRWSRRLGIRTVRLERTPLCTPDHPGRFQFWINGERVFCKGSNWVPADAFHSRDAGRIPEMLALFADMGCNMVRCWGGNVYEPHLFFDLCDREGIMVWQDFSMACAAYPQAPAFLEAMRVEAEWVVRELRNHPSVMLWSGDNECDCGYVGWWGTPVDPATNRLTRKVLPDVVAALDPSRPYLPSSPYVSPEMFARGGDQHLGPEQHLWGPRDYYKSDYYARNTACFASEMGYHGCPNVSSIRRFISPKALWPWQDNHEWQVHSTDPMVGISHIRYRIQLMADQLMEVFGVIPQDLDTFALASQIVQAEAKKFFVEIFRQHKWRTSGVLWWNMIDGWPQFSDAIVDYYYSRKLAYHYLKRVHTPVCIVVGEPESWNCRVTGCNDSREPARGHFRIHDADSGQTLLEGALDLPANANAGLGHIRAPRGVQRLFLIEWEAHGARGVNHYLLGTPPFDLEQYRRWLPALAALDGSFDATRVGQ